MTGASTTSVPVQPAGRRVPTREHTWYVTEAGSGAPTMFLHGGGPGSTGWTDFGPVLPWFETDRRCYLVDLLQYGQSDKPAIVGPRWEGYARHLLALLDALDVDRVDLVCNSWGGSIALALAASYPERVGKLVVTGSMPVVRGPHAPSSERIRMGRTVRDRYYAGPDGPTLAKMRELLATVEWYDPAAIPDATVELRWRHSLDPDEIACGQQPHRRGTPQDLAAELGRISAPVLFLWGMQDAFLDPGYALMLARQVERGNLRVLDRAGHHPQEERPAHYAAAVRAFLDCCVPCAGERG
jgi:pimeloyl-ACP methyl ester carboxylesterase